MPYYTDPTTGQRVEVHVERWGRRYRGLAITLSIVLGVFGAWLGLMIGAALTHAFYVRNVSALIELALGVAGWVLASIGIYRGLSGPRRR